MHVQCVLLFWFLHIGQALIMDRARLEKEPPMSIAPVQVALSDADLFMKSSSTLSVEEKQPILQGSHYGLLGPESGYYTGNTLPIERLGLPALKMQDAGNGFHTTESGTEGTTTAWPTALALAATWDEKLVEEVAVAMGSEFHGKGANVMLGPAVNVHRVAQNGRNFEYLSGEDPYLGARLTNPFVRGVQSQGVMCTLKHFAFNEQETNRMSESSNVDMRTAWELYYPPFEAAVQAGAGAFMCAYNKVNGTYACHSKDILKRDLRGAMGFQGIVMSDWTATHGVDAIEAGMDQELPGKLPLSDGEFTIAALGTVDPISLDTAAAHVQAAIFNTGLNQGVTCTPPDCMEYIQSDQTSEAHSTLARAAATSSVTLLKNEDDILPINPADVRKVAVFGRAASHKGPEGATMKFSGDYYSGGGSGHTYAGSVVTPLSGIQDRAAIEEIEVVAFTDSNEELDQGLLAAKDADVIVVVAATTSSEGADRASLALDEDADTLISALGSLEKPTMVLMQTPGAVLTPWRNLSHVKGIANLFLAGEQTGNAWAAVLFGDVSPSGKLPIMFPASASDVIPPGTQDEVPYTEGLFTSYRSPTLHAAFPFGHGLSYTNFDFGTPELVADGCGEMACVKITITNTGEYEGTETAQAYIQFAPELHEPELVLRGFAKIKLNPGMSKEAFFPFTERDLSVYSVQFGWMPQKNVQVHIGASSADLRRSISL